MSYWFLLPLAAGLALLLLNRAIRHSLAAPRIVEDNVPDALPWREARIPTERGRQLYGWFIPAGERAPALAVLHGWGGNAEMMLPLAAPLHRAGYALLLFDARGHGRSDDDTFASLPRFAEDLTRAVAWLRRQPEVDAGRIGLVGHSVGAAAALLVAARQHDLAAVVSLAAFAHPTTMMRRWLATRHIPYWPFGAYILFYVERVIGHRFAAIAPTNSISRVTCPVLLAHGKADTTVPISEALEIHAARRDERVELLLMPGSHDQYEEIEKYTGRLTEFLDRALQPEKLAAAHTLPQREPI